MSDLAMKGDGRDWARKIINRIDYGQKVGIYAAWCARQALGLPEPEPAHRIRTRNARKQPEQQAVPEYATDNEFA